MLSRRIPIRIYNKILLHREYLPRFNSRKKRSSYQLKKIKILIRVSNRSRNSIRKTKANKISGTLNQR